MLTKYPPDVFNTEAQPLKAPPAKFTYGDGTLTPTPTKPFPFPFQPSGPPIAQISPGPMLGDRLTKIITQAISDILGSAEGCWACRACP